MQTPPRPERRAFTLIELLVVVAVIAILASLLFPALNSVRETGRAARCRSNLRQLQVAVVQYTSNNNGKMPCATSSKYQKLDGSWVHKQGWLEWWNFSPSSTPDTLGSYDWVGANGLTCVTNGALYQYTHASGIYACPSVLHANQNAIWTYSMSSNLTETLLIVWDAPANTVMFGDSAAAMAAGSYTAQFDPIDTTVAGMRAKKPGQFYNIHRNTANVVFLDGHVESF